MGLGGDHVEMWQELLLALTLKCAFKAKANSPRQAENKTAFWSRCAQLHPCSIYTMGSVEPCSSRMLFASDV